jgi:acetylcholinesterase
MATTVLNATGCSDDLACLRGLSFDAIFAAANGTFNPSVIPDGDFIQDPVFKLINDGKVAQVPLILGANLDEATSGIGAPVGIQNDTQFRTAVAREFRPDSHMMSFVTAHLPVTNASRISGAYSTLYPSNSTLDQFLEVFPDDPSRGSPFGTGDGVLPTGLQDKRINWVYTDGLHAGIRYLARAQSKQAPVYKYHFTQVPQNGTIDAGVAHFYEIPYVSRSLPVSCFYTLTKPTRLLLVTRYLES